MRIILLIVLTVFLMSCKNSNGQNKTIDDVKIIKSDVATIINHIELDSFILNSGNYSSEGFCVMNNDSIYLVDKIFSTISSFNLKGDFLKQFLGKKSKFNLQSLSSLSFIDDGSFIITDRFKFLKFTNQWNFVDSSYLIYPKTIDNNVLLDNPKGEYPDLYEIKYNKNSIPNKGRYLLIEVESEHPKFNGFSTLGFFTTARNFALIDPKTWHVNPIFGSWPKSYKSGKNYPYFANINYQFSNQNFYVNYEIDSLIYVFDRRYVPKFAFGRSGKITNKSYKSSKSISYAFNDSLRISERETKGYYDEIFVQNSRSLIFRSYFTGKKREINLHRMQIYKETALIGDIQIPNTFRIIGYNNSHFFADGGEQNGEKIIYKFKLNDI